MRHLLRTVAFGLGVALLMPTTAAMAGETLVITTIEQKVKKVIKRFQPMADYLAEALADDGVDAVEISVMPDRTALIAALRRGDVDLYFDSPLIMAAIMQEAPLRPALRRWKKGVAEYHSVFFTRADSNVGALEQLRGQVIAFERDFSTSGYLLPKSTLIKHGLTVSALSRRDDPVAADEIGYVFSNDDANTMLWVLRGAVVAGVVDSETFKDIVAKRPNEFKKIDRSESVPRQVLGIRTGLAPAITEAVSDELLKMHLSETGRTALESSKTARFDRFRDGAEATFARMAQILARLDVPLTN